METKKKLSLKDAVTRNIKALRLETDLTQQELADRCGFKVQYVSRLENFPQNISLDILEKLADGLKCDVTDLLIRSDSKSSTKSTRNAHEPIEEAMRQLKIAQARIGRD